MMRVNLITVTTGRWQELGRMLQSARDCREAKVRHIVIWLRDFGSPPPPDSVADEAELRDVRGVRSLSRGRNMALKDAQADIIGFPDDDCRYPGGTLDKVIGEFRCDSTLDGFTGRTLTEDGREVHARYHTQRHRISKTDVPFCGNSNTMFFRGEFVARLGAFDERLGVGTHTKFGGAEDWDYLMRAAAVGKVVYDPQLVVLHPMPSDALSRPQHRRRSWRYANGTGALYVKQRLPPWTVAWWILRPQAGALLALCRGQWHKAADRSLRSLALTAGAIRWSLRSHE